MATVNGGEWDEGFEAGLRTHIGCNAQIELAAERLTVALRFAERDDHLWWTESSCDHPGCPQLRCLVAKADFDAAPTLDELLRRAR